MLCNLALFAIISSWWALVVLEKVPLLCNLLTDNFSRFTIRRSRTDTYVLQPDLTFANFQQKHIEYKGVQCMLEILDTAGQETFSGTISALYSLFF